MIADFVINHTSDQHPWFRSACASRDSPYRDFYVWADKKPKEKQGDVVFPDQEDSNWAWSKQARQWYLHRFYSHQPDLNVANPRVRDEIAQIMGFWLDLGLSGFRIDAVPFLIEPVGPARGLDRRPARAAARPARVRQPPQRRGDPARRGQPAGRRTRASSSATRTATSCTCCSTSSATRRCTCRSRAATPSRCERRCATPRRSRTRLDGALRAQPRRADARQAQRGRARRGLRALRPRRGHAALRPRAAPPPAADARRRPGGDPHGLLAGVLAARRRRSCSTARRSAWARTSRSRAAQRALADAVVGGAPRRVLDRADDPRALLRPAHRRRVRPAARQRRRAAARPRLAAELVRAPHPPPPRVPGDRLRRR